MQNYGLVFISLTDRALKQKPIKNTIGSRHPWLRFLMIVDENKSAVILRSLNMIYNRHVIVGF